MIILPNKDEILKMLWDEPIKIGHWIGFTDLTELNNEWLRLFLYSDEDVTLQAHRGSYKTTTLSLFFAIHSVIFPNENIIYNRKSASDVMEIARQTAKILNSGCMKKISKILYGNEYSVIKETNIEISTNLPTTASGSAQILGLGIGSSITGKHADIVVTDDIINVKDRASEAERNKTKLAYQELNNIKNRGGRFINTGTPWHKDDAFDLMPNIRRYDCYSTGLITDEQLEELRERMSPSLFAANYELKHISDEDVIFANPVVGGDISLVYNGICQVDSAFYGEDYTAMTIAAKRGEKIYMLGMIWRKHVEDCYPDIMRYFNQTNCKRMFMETNADKGMVAKEIRKLGIPVVTYHEDMNKHIKIVTYLKAIWKDVVFVDGTMPDYIEQITDYNEDASHDDAPDSASSMARILVGKQNKIGTLDKRLLGL